MNIITKEEAAYLIGNPTKSINDWEVFKYTSDEQKEQPMLGIKRGYLHTFVFVKVAGVYEYSYCKFLAKTKEIPNDLKNTHLKIARAGAVKRNITRISIHPVLDAYPEWLNPYEKLHQKELFGEPEEYNECLT